MPTKYSPIDLNSTAGFYEEYYNQQHGNGLAVFRGKRHMDGAGIGNILGSLFKSVGPTIARFGKSAARTVGRHAMNVARDVIAGEDLQTSALRNLKAGGADVLNDIMDSPKPSRKRKRAAGSGKNSKRQKRGTIFE